MKECEVVLEVCMVPNVEEERSKFFVIKMNMKITKKGMTTLVKNCVMCHQKRQEKSLRSIDYWRSQEK